ncbi:MAG: DUF4394 domain-containing protein [Ferruginibacter sp.]
MKQLPTFTKVAAIALLIGLNSCKKELIENPANPGEATTAITDESGRLGFTNFNRNLTFYALTTDNKLDNYSTLFPKRLLGTATISGLQAEESILAVDFRPSTGQLYGLGSSSRIYVINPSTGVARAIGAGPFTPSLVGDVAGFDFNPTVDRIRIVTSSGQNLRANPETGTIAFVDGPINGQPGAIVAGAAYTNNMAGATTTTLYGIDRESDNLYIQNPPNNGTLVLVGPLGSNVDDGGFDIANTGDAFAMLSIGGVSNLASMDLTTGQANIITNYPTLYRGFAIGTKPVAYMVDGGNNLMIFNPQLYYTAANLNTIITKPITGLAVGDTIAGIDFRPLNGQLYALGRNSNVYTINTASGAATLVSALSVPLSGSRFGFDFNPFVDRIRIVSNSGQNLRYNPNDFTVTVDLSLNPATASIAAAAYSNNFAGTASTTLYGIDSTGVLVQINPPNNGTVVPVGSLGVYGNTVASFNGFDIGGTSGIAYTLFRSTNNRSRLYEVNLSTGVATGRAIVGTSQVNGLAIGLGF